MQSRGNKALAIAKEIVGEAVAQSLVYQAGGKIIAGAPSDAVKEAATNALARLYPQFAAGDHSGWDKVRTRALRKDPDAMKAVDHAGAPESHLVCRAVLGDLGPGRKGSDLRSTYTGPPYGWSQDAVDGALVVLANAGLLRVTGDDGKPASLPDLPRQKWGTCTIRAETTIITIAERMPVRGLLTKAGIAYENNQEQLALSALLERLESAAMQSGGEPPAPEPEVVPNLSSLKSLSGNDLLVALAADAAILRDKLEVWGAAATKARGRLPNWRLAERLVALGASGQQGDLDEIRSHRQLLAEPDPLPPVLAAAADSLRQKLNTAYSVWDSAWKDGERRLADDPTWDKLSPEQKHRIRQECGLLMVAKPEVDTAETIADSLTQRSLSEWENMSKASAARIEEALESAAVISEPSAHVVSLPGALLRTDTEVAKWLATVRELILKALADGPAIPRV